MNLPHISKRITIGVTQQPALKNNITEDFKSFFYRHNKILLYLVKHFPNNRRLKICLRFRVTISLNLYISKILSLPHYQKILDVEYKEITKILRKLKIKVSLNGINDIAGWSFVNADFASWFNTDRRISITSGTCYFAHVFCRCLQPFIIEQQYNTKMCSLLHMRMNRQFRRTTIGLLTHDHSKAFSFFNLIPEDESLLSGIEKFIILHEMGHAYYSASKTFSWPYPQNPSSSIKNRIEKDEEVMADIFAIHALYHIYQDNTDQKLLLFAPYFFFLIYSWLEDASLIPKPREHPSNLDRCTYLMNESQYLISNPDYFKYIEVLNLVWEKNKQYIITQTNKRKKTLSIYSEILENIGKKMKDILDKISDQ